MRRAWGAKLRVLYDANRQEGNRLGAALAYLWGFGQLVSRKLDFGFWEIFLHMLCAMRVSPPPSILSISQIVSHGWSKSGFQD